MTVPMAPINRFATFTRVWHPRPALAGLAAFLFAAALALADMGRVHGGDPTGPYLIGAHSTQTRIHWPMPVKIYPIGDGFDGQYYLILALDPFLQTPMIRGLDRPSYRARRIAVPLLAWTTGLGQPRAIVWTLHLWSWVFVALGAWGLARWAMRSGASPWWGMAYAVSLGTFITIWRVVGDAWAASVLILLLLCDAERRPLLTGAAALLLLLCKETMAVAIVAVGVAALVRRDRPAIFSIGAACVAAALWYAWGRWASRGMENYGETLFNFSWPVVGPLQALRMDFAAPKALSHKIKDVVFIGAHLISLVAGLGIGVRTLRQVAAHRQVDVPGLALGLYALMALFFSFPVWAEVWAYGRILMPLPVMGLMWGLAHRRSDGGERLLALTALAGGVLCAMCGLAFAALELVRAVP